MKKIIFMLSFLACAACSSKGIDGEYNRIEQTAFEKPFLYPNPATDKLYLQSDEMVKTIHITNLSGNLILLIQPNTRGNITIPVSELSAGTYILQLTTDSGIKVSKFIKK